MRSATRGFHQGRSETLERGDLDCPKDPGAHARRPAADGAAVSFLLRNIRVRIHNAAAVAGKAMFNTAK